MIPQDPEDCYSESAYTRDFACFKTAIAGIESSCGKLDHYGLYYTSQLVRTHTHPVKY